MDDKDVIIAPLLAEIQPWRAENKLLREEIARLKKNSGNSSKPPSSDMVKGLKSKGRDTKETVTRRSERPPGAFSRSVE